MVSVTAAQLTVETDDKGSLILNCSGDWINTAVATVEQQLSELIKNCHQRSVRWHWSQLTDIDSAGMVLYIHYSDLMTAQGCSVESMGTSSGFEQFHQLIHSYISDVDSSRKTFQSRLFSPLTALGEASHALLMDSMAFLHFFGETCLALLAAIRRPLAIRYDAIIKHIEETGVRALPIIALTSVLIGIVFTYQGAVQLEKFGANIFIVDMVSISMTRELAPLITAIVVAGRTGSAFTAQLGVMHITEEIPAMRTMGFDPQQYLVLPRMVALMITLPLLVVFADIVGLAASMFISNIQLNLSYMEFTHRLQSVLDMKHVIIGLIKAPIFAWLIALVGCFRGFQVERNTESIGRYTTLSVVNAVFLVIACDALFSVILTELKL